MILQSDIDKLLNMSNEEVENSYHFQFLKTFGTIIKNKGKLYYLENSSGLYF